MSTAPELDAATGQPSPLARYLKSDPVLLALLFVLAVAFFLAVTGLSRLYHAQQDSLGNRWFTRGIADLNVRNFNAAALEFRTALRYSRDNYSYQLNLAEALIGSKRTAEAQAYLANLWDREPENGFVNLELARIAAHGGDTEHALRYYHNAIYATWPSDSGNDVKQRREVRLELIEYLLKINATAQAQAELIALAANAESNPDEQVLLGDLFIRAQDYEHALAAYQLSLKGVNLRNSQHNAAAEAGAGLAAFQLGQYRVALRYLQTAVTEDPNDTKSETLLKQTQLILQLNPYEGDISAAQRGKILVRDFAIAGDRLKACGIPAGAAGPLSSLGTPQSLGDQWTQMKARVTEQGVERDPDLMDTAMELVLDIERETASTCGTASDADQALLMIAKSREGR
jgi:tetratricopeptide (TPR) repeat protein